MLELICIKLNIWNSIIIFCLKNPDSGILDMYVGASY